VKLRDQAYQAFIQHLLHGPLQPGQFVTQRDLVELIGFPLGAIREMIPRLEADGLIQSLPQRCLQVAAVDLRLVREAFQLREVVETAAIAHFVRHAPEKSVVELRAAFNAIMRGFEAGITPELLEQAQVADWAFHDAIVGHMGNSLLGEVHRVNVVRIRVIMQERAMLSDVALPAALAEHGAIITALERRDEADAVSALRAHIESARERALGFEVFDNETRSERPLRRKA
jgi:DNA-binding GntR family transcriptional regulator